MYPFKIICFIYNLIFLCAILLNYDCRQNHSGGTLLQYYQDLFYFLTFCFFHGLYILRGVWFLNTKSLDFLYLINHHWFLLVWYLSYCILFCLIKSYGLLCMFFLCSLLQQRKCGFLCKYLFLVEIQYYILFFKKHLFIVDSLKLIFNICLYWRSDCLIF